MPVPTKSSFYLPAVDISPYLQDPNSDGARKVINDVRAACTSTGFFQLLGHGISPELQRSVFAAAAKFFALPTDVKSSCRNVGFRGYDPMASQSYEPGVLPDLKESFISGTDIPLDDPRVMSRRFFMGQNAWPPGELLPETDFRRPVEEYYQAMMKLCWAVLDLVAATLPYGPHVFDEFKENDPACPLRLLHYPPTPAPDVVKGRQLGSSAHTDFGAITLLLQDDHPGLEVQDRETGDWIGVPPKSDAYVVNRVINKNLTDRYSVVFFFDGNLDYKLRPLDRVEQDQDEENVLTVEEHMLERTTTTYNTKAK